MFTIMHGCNLVKLPVSFRPKRTRSSTYGLQTPWYSLVHEDARVEGVNALLNKEDIIKYRLTFGPGCKDHCAVFFYEQLASHSRGFYVKCRFHKACKPPLCCLCLSTPTSSSSKPRLFVSQTAVGVHHGSLKFLVGLHFVPFDNALDGC